MKKISCSLFSFLLLGCTKSVDKPQHQAKYGTVIFYTLNITQNNKWQIYIDNSYKGLEPFTAVVPSCQYDIGLGLHLQLSTGRHHVTFKSLEGYADWTKDILVNEGCQTEN